MLKKYLSILLLFSLLLQPVFSQDISMHTVNYQKLTNSQLLMQFKVELIILQNMKDQEMKSISDLEKQSQNSKESIETEKKLLTNDKDSLISENESLEKQTELSNDSQILMDQHKEALAGLNKSIESLKKEITKMENKMKFWRTATLISVGIIILENLLRSLFK